MEKLFILTCMFAAFTDFVTYKIPNALILAILLICSMNLVFVDDWNSVVLSVAALLGGLLVGFVMYHFNYFGAGDAKLLAVCAMWMINVDLLGFILLVSFAGGVVALFYKFFGSSIQKFRAYIESHMQNMLPEQYKESVTIAPELKEALANNQIIPYGVPIFIGALVRVMM